MNKQNYKIGFYKAVQGSFTDERISAIKQQLKNRFNAEIIEADFREGVLIDGLVYVGDICLNECDIYFWHDTLKPSLSGADNYYIHLLRALQKDTIVINDAESTYVTNDKLRAHQALQSHGLPVSHYAFVRSDDRSGIAKAFTALGQRVLVKPRFGGWGSGIIRCESLEDLHSTIELITSFAGDHMHILLEAYYDNDPHQWTSVSLIGQQVVASYRKPLSLSGSDWKVYDPEKKDGRGQRSEAVEPSQDLIHLAKKAQAALGKDIVGFDFIMTDRGPVIVDENSRPGLYEHCLTASNTQLVDVIVDLIGNKLTIDKN